MKIPAMACALAALALSACADNDSSSDNGGKANDVPQITPTDAPVKGTAALDFDTLELGGKIVGPVGPEVQASLATDLAAIGDIVGYVACVKGTDTCDPKTAPKSMVYTYVYTVTPGVDLPNDDKFPQPEAIDPVTKATAFKMVLPALGYTGVAGYSKDQARDALGADGAFTVTCNAEGLTFELANGTEWSTGEPITFFWKSTLPPKGPMDAFLLEADGKTGIGAGPSPTTRGDAGNNEKAVCP